MSQRRFFYVFTIMILVMVLTSQPFPMSSVQGKAPGGASSPAMLGIAAAANLTNLAIVTPIPANPCAASTPSSGAYSVTLCFTAPQNDSTIIGNAPVNVSVAVTGTSPGVQRMVFYMNGVYLLTDYQSPYTFTLPSAKWKDGVASLQVEALMRDGYTTASRAGINLTFNNGNTTPPVNTLSFTPATGTTPSNGAPFIVVAAGDGASGEASSNNVTNLITSLSPNLFLYLGDVYEKGSVSEFFNWYGASGSNFSALRSITDPTIGNHEYSTSGAAGYFDYWNNVPNYYSFNAGGWHFISLNSNSTRIGVSKTSSQYQWLAQDLAANAQACTIVYYHHPLYNIGPEGPTTAMADIWSLMAQNGVTLVLNGHDHDYQRWVPLNGAGQPDPSGITEFVAGGAGHGLQTIASSDSRVVYSSDLNPTAFGALKLGLSATGASFSYVNTTGAVLDSGVVPCLKSGADTLAPSTPGGFTAGASSATRVDMSWGISTDNTGVAGYTIYRNGVSLTTVSSTTLNYSDTTASPNTTYTYAVDAYDLAGNHSVLSDPVSVTTPAIPANFTFLVQADTYVNSASPTSKYGSATVFRLLNSTSDLHGYLRFTVQGLAGSPIVRARLLVYTNTSTSLGISALGVADNSWNEATVTYNTAPALGSLITTSGAIKAGSWVTLDVTPFVTGEGTYSFGLTTPSASTLSFAAREGGVNVAQLIIDLQ